MKPAGYDETKRRHVVRVFVDGDTVFASFRCAACAAIANVEIINPYAFMYAVYHRKKFECQQCGAVRPVWDRTGYVVYPSRPYPKSFDGLVAQ